MSRHSPTHVAVAGTVGDRDGFQAGAKLAMTNPFESLRAGAVDANVPPEALRSLARQYHSTATVEHVQASSANEEEEEIPTEYDPWERFNRAMFAFNQQVDRRVLKPAAKVWDKILPDLVQESLHNAIDNLSMPRRLINNILQLKPEGAGRELARFLINISMGVGGFFDAASEVGIPKSDTDMGLTLGHYGVGPGPYLVLPFQPPSTVRDTIGYAADIAMDPRAYVFPFAANFGIKAGQVVNDRALNLETFEEFERAVFDLYTAVRNAYLQRRQQALAE
jgi:phospholipid-binding lipoprotein MlaA